MMQIVTYIRKADVIIGERYRVLNRKKRQRETSQLSAGYFCCHETVMT